MSHQRVDLDSAVRTWLEDGVSVMPDRILDAVLDELPSVAQRGRSVRWGGNRRFAGWMAVAAAALVAAVGIAFAVRPWIADRPALVWRAFPSEPVQSLEAGPYLIGAPFPVRIGFTMPPGWHADGVRSTLAALGLEGGGLTFTVVEGVYADPCHLEEGLLDPGVGPTADDLASALAGLPGVRVSGPTDTTVGGRPALALTVTAPESFESCTESDGGPLFRLWGVPEWHWLDPGERNRLWIVEVGAVRLVISAEEYPDASPAALAALNEVIASIDIEPSFEAGVVGASRAPTPKLPTLPMSGPLEAAEYQFFVRLHRYTDDGVPVPLTGPHRGIVTVPEGWSSIGSGIRDDGRSGAQISVGTAARIFRDPCRWRTSTEVDPRTMTTLDGMAEALSAWDAAAPSAPDASPPLDVPRFSHFGRVVELSIPEDVVLADCDGGEYRLWEDLAGYARVARAPGESIELFVVDYEPGLLIVDASLLPEATEQDRADLQRLLLTLWVFARDDAR